jgi:hypothetical protein
VVQLKGRPRHIRGWVDGIVEGAEPDVAQPQGTFPRGTVDSAVNLVSTPAGRLAIRRGSRVKQTPHTAASALVQRVLGAWPYSQLGAVAIAHSLSGGTPETNLYRLTSDLGYSTGTEATSRHALSWPTNTTDVPRPVVVELFENLYIVDAHTDFALRNALQKVNALGVVTSPTHNLDGISAAAIKAYCAAEYNGVLFLAGYDSSSGGEEKAMLRHSFLGVDPAAANGFDKDAYALIGAKGQRITAMAAGRQILLVAKANELYRITGTGRGLPGWQYTIQQVENTQGMGVSNPYALCFAEGYWWGVGETGPFRTDGSSVEPLVSARLQVWRQVTNLRTAWVCYWPDRRLVKFGFNVTPADAGRSTTYPFVIWNWDIDNECWTGDEKYSVDIHFAQAIPTLTASPASVVVPPPPPPPPPPGPSGTPSTLASSTADSTTSQVRYTWTNGDATAQTELWFRNESGASMLYSVEAPGVTGKTIPVTDAGRIFFAKVRHTKDGLTSSFTGEVQSYTLLPTPFLTKDSSGLMPDGVTTYATWEVGPVSYLHPSTQTHIVGTWGLDVVTSASGGGSVRTYSSIPAGSSVTVNFTNSTWPLGYRDSPTATLALT